MHKVFSGRVHKKPIMVAFREELWGGLGTRIGRWQIFVTDKDQFLILVKLKKKKVGYRKGMYCGTFWGHRMGILGLEDIIHKMLAMAVLPVGWAGGTAS